MQDLFNALSGVASLGLAVTANVVVFVLSLLRKYYAAQEKKLMQEMHQAEEEAHSDV